MNTVSTMLVAYACISHGDHKPDGFPVSRVYMCAPPLVEVAAAVPVRVKRKTSRCDGSKAECKISRVECGAEFNDWYWKKGRRKFRCR